MCSIPAMSFENPTSIVTRSTRAPHPDDRVSLWRQKRFVAQVREDLRRSIQRVLDDNRHWLGWPTSFVRLPQLDDLLEFLAIDRKRQPITPKTVCRFCLTALGGVVVLVLSFYMVVIIATAMIEAHGTG